jgi:hypothetical protein
MAIDDPKRTLIVVGEDGKYYKLTERQWKKGTALTPSEKGVVDALTKWGSYLSYIPPAEKVGIGSVCTIVNLRSILKNQT